VRAVAVAGCVITFAILAPGLRGAPLGQPAPAPTGTTSTAVTAASRPSSAGCPGARRGLVYYRHRANDYQLMRDAARFRVGRAHRSPSCAFVRWAAEVWRDRAIAARRAFEHWFDRTYAKWRCIHGHEAAWDDQHAPHYGGLQFDDDFQRTYGPGFFVRWGDAGNWPVWAQLIAAERAYQTRGFGPWPNTRRMCGI
jgi:hypothetical protein